MELNKKKVTPIIIYHITVNVKPIILILINLGIQQFLLYFVLIKGVQSTH